MDASYVSVTNGGPDAVMDAALPLRNAGADLGVTFEAMKQAIQNLEDQQPWGQDDKTAKAIKGSYLEPAEQVKKSLSQLAEAWSQLGDKVIESMAKIGTTDGDGGRSIDSTFPA